jgi:hypothetical protein
MTSHPSTIVDHATRKLNTNELYQIDLAWQKEYERFLDLGREPRPVNERSLMLISAFFMLSWGLSTWNGLAQLTPAIATTTIVSIASIRSNSFDRAYRQYLRQRAEVISLAQAQQAVLQ